MHTRNRGINYLNSLYIEKKYFVEGYTQYEYCDNLIYENEKLSQVLFDGGYIPCSGGDAYAPSKRITNPLEPWDNFTFMYYDKDHLGNVLSRRYFNVTVTI